MTRISEDLHDEVPEPMIGGNPCTELEWYESRKSTLGGGLTIRRALPLRELRMVGAWCFLDHFGPLSVQEREEAMWVGAHPHTGLQTVTWLLDGEVMHRDSIGSEQMIRPGQLNVMTSGHGISHTEETPVEHSEHLHGLQFWVALPHSVRDMEPAFEHHAQLPVVESDNTNIHVFFGKGFGGESPATAHSPMVGADIELNGTTTLTLDPTWEYGVVTVEDPIKVNGRTLSPGQFSYTPPGFNMMELSSEGPARVAVIGGEPFGEKILLWWNFVGRSQEEIVEFTKEWNSGDRFGEVEGFPGDRLVAPELRGVRL